MSFAPNFCLGGTPHFVAAALAIVAGGSHACAGDLVFLGDFENGTSIPWLRQNTAFAAGASFVLEPALVTATKLTNSNTKLTLFVQVPQALAPAPYPKWAAIETYGDAVGVAPAIGDCVRVQGTLVDFNGATEISPMTWTAATALDCANAVIVPFTVTIADIATDTTSATPGNQPGISAEAYESVLLTLINTYVLTSSTNGVFNIYDGFSSGTYLSVGDFLYHYNAFVGTHFSTITGVLEESDSLTDPVYQLLPRSASDIVVGP